MHASVGAEPAPYPYSGPAALRHRPRVAIVLFALAMAESALAWRRAHA
jgi:hypothetical protein